MKNTKYENKDIIILLVMAVVSIVINFINGYGTSSQMFGGFILGIMDILIFSAYLFISRTPVIANSAVLLYAILSVVYNLVAGATFKEAVSDAGTAVVLGIIAVVITLIVAVKKIKDKKNFKNIIFYDRKIHRLGWYYKIMIYSMLIVAVMSLSNSSQINTYIDGTAWRAYAALTILFPLIRMISLVSTTTFAYEIYGLYIFTEVFTLYMQYKANGLRGIDIVFVVQEIIVLMYCAYRCKVLNKETEKKVEEKQ